MLPLLIDTDIFCELGTADLLRDSVRVLGCRLSDCARLPALPYMLRRGTLVARHGADACHRLLPLAEKMAAAPNPRGPWLDKLGGIADVDPGEAQLFAAAADRGLTVLTGDGRALRAVRLVEGFPDALAGRVVTRVAILLALCSEVGPERVRQAVGGLVTLNKTIQVCFSNPADDPREGLTSYHNSDVQELSPLVLWDPLAGGDRDR